MSTNHTAQIAPTSYLQQRLGALGLTIDDADRHGLTSDEHGNILQAIRTFTGRPILYLDSRGDNARRIKLMQNRKTFSEHGDIEQFERPLSILRVNPANLRPGEPKYRYPSKDTTKLPVKPLPTLRAIDAYNGGVTGGVGVGIEGYFKGIALSVSGIEAVAFTGISTYKMCDDMIDYIVSRKFDDYVIMYDADARELKTKPGQIPSAKRIIDFYNSAQKFAGAFYDTCKRHNLHTRLHFAIVSEDAGHKGIDDLLEANPDKRGDIVRAFNTFKSSEYFTFVGLPKSAFTQRLKEFFTLSNHNDFYNRYRGEIGLQPFKIGKATYQYTHGSASELFDTPTSYIKLLDNPFAVEHPGAIDFTVKRYLSEIDGELSNILTNTPRVCLSAPTGTGKNAFFLGYHDGKRRQRGYFEKTNTRGVITVPTVTLCKQLASKLNVPGLHGHVSIREAERATDARVIVCTYDTLHRVTDLHARTLVVDEAHNLVNQYGDIENRVPFRAEVLRRVVGFFDVAQSAILMSGTPPDLLAAVLHFKMVRVNRVENNNVFVKLIEALTSSPDALTAEALAQMSKMDLHDGRIRFVYYNSKKQLNVIAQGLMQVHGLTQKDIAIITRDDVSDGTHAVYNGIINRSQIEGAKVVLSTCLIAEGINIENTNIGEVVTVGVNCPDSFRQYVARFRSMAKIDVISIMPPERLLSNTFFLPATEQYSYMQSIAEVHRVFVAKSVEQYGDDIEMIDAGLMPYVDDVRPNYKYRSELFTGVYSDDAGRVQIDTLYMCAAIRERGLKKSNNAYFYSQILSDNIHLSGTGAIDVSQTTDALSLVKDAKDILKAIKNDVMTRLRVDLQRHPAAVVSAYYERVRKSGNRHAVSRLEALVPGLLNEPTAEAYAAIRADDIKEKYYTEALNRYVRAIAAAGYVGTAIDAIDAQPADFSRRYNQFKRAVEKMLYTNRRTRIMLKPEHRAEALFYMKVKDAIREIAVNGTITLSDAKKLIKERTRATAQDGKKIQAIRATAQDVERIVRMLFDVSVNKMPSGEHVYRLSELPPLPPIDNPTRFVCIFG